jgi:transposase-like protein
MYVPFAILIHMIQFPITELLNEQGCYDFLLTTLHPQGLCCPHGHALPPEQRPHNCNRAPIVEYRCRDCGAVFNIFSRTALKGIRYDCRTIVLLLRGFSQGVSTNHLSKELSVDYSCILEWRHRWQEFAFEHRSTETLPDTIQESDEVFLNAGEKGVPHLRPDDPPRRRANKKKGLAPIPATVLPSKERSGEKRERFV